MRKTTFHVAKMDCPSEERTIRMRLEGVAGIQSLRFDLERRTLEVYHTGDHAAILAALAGLRLDAGVVSSEAVSSRPAEKRNTGEDRRRESLVLRQVLGINMFFFVLEMLTGFVAGSMGLVADSLDMLADSIVYALSLFAVGGTLRRKKNIAGAAGYLQLALAVMGFAEVVRRFLGHGEAPNFGLMILISLFALAGNAICLSLLRKSGGQAAHMRASVIFTSTDVVVNLGVIVAGILVYLTASKLPDLAVGTIVFILVGRGAYRILQLAR